MALRILIFLISLAAAGGAGWMTLNMQQRDLAEQATAVEPEPIPTIDVLVAVQPVTAGEVLTTEMLRWQPWPKAQVNGQFVIHADQPQAIDELTGSFVNRAFAAGEPIREDRLMETNANLLSNKIASGMRAVAVKITAENTAGGFILPGDRVDVIQTTSQLQDDRKTTVNESRIIISNVRVLAIDQTAVQNPEGSALGSTATLELSPADSERIVTAEASGMLSLVLRAVADHDAQEVPKIDVLVAVQAIPAGQSLSAQMLRWEAWPKAQLTDQFITHADRPHAIIEMTGSLVNRAIDAEEPIRMDRLTKTVTNLMSNRITPGMRAAAVSITAENTAGGFILPGDRVDVIQTKAPASDDTGTSGGTSRIILRNVRVLAIDQTAVQNPEGSAIGKTATLELTPSAAEHIMAAEASGTLSLVLRSVEDHDLAEQHLPPRTLRTVRIHRADQTSTVTLR